MATTTKPTYVWKNSFAPPIDAQVAGEELARISDSQGGELTPAAVVEAATPEASPLHPAFTWDDSQAAVEYRLQQARHLIRSIEIVRVEKPQQQQQHAVYVSTVTRDSAGKAKRSYAPLDVHVLSSEKIRSAVMMLQAHVNSTQHSANDVLSVVTQSGTEQQRERSRSFTRASSVRCRDSCGDSANALTWQARCVEAMPVEEGQPVIRGRLGTVWCAKARFGGAR